MHRLDRLRDRAEMLAQARHFFAERNILEVDCSVLSPHAAIASHIDVIPAEVAPFQIGYLHTSPEYAMKRLLSEGIGDIYFLGHVFRQGEIGRLHNPEFTMAEWYRLGLSFEQMMQETALFIALFLGPVADPLADPRAMQVISYREAFETYLDIDYARASLAELHRIAEGLGCSPDASSWPRETLLHFLLAHGIEPHFGKEQLTFLIDYPPEQAALARVVQKAGESVAQRFEAYYRGIELCNGYHELPDARELRSRFKDENAIRIQAGKPAYALDEQFLSAIGPSFPDCCGVSVGIDRLLLLKHNVQELSDVLPFAWKS